MNSRTRFSNRVEDYITVVTGLYAIGRVTGATFDWLADRPIEAEALSFFASADFQISDKWELTGGVRWTDEEKSTSVAFPYVHTGVVAIFGKHLVVVSGRRLQVANTHDGGAVVRQFGGDEFGLLAELALLRAIANLHLLTGGTGPHPDGHRVSPGAPQHGAVRDVPVGARGETD